MSDYDAPLDKEYTSTNRSMRFNRLATMLRLVRTRNLHELFNLMVVAHSKQRPWLLEEIKGLSCM